jgi:subtilase family serine protease
MRGLFRVRAAALSAVVLAAASALLLASAPVAAAKQNDQLAAFHARLPIHVKRHSSGGPIGLSPAAIKAAYNLTNAGNGSGTIAIVDAYDSPTVQADLNTFSAQYGLPQCTNANPCFEKHRMANRIKADSGWALEASLDTQWAHAIAPGAKILLVESRTASGQDLLSAVNYARSRADVVAISMSWGGSEFSAEASYDGYFTSGYGATFFASSGDNGTGVSWPAVSPNVVGVGGTTLNYSGNTLVSETAWSGSGGGVSQYESMPAFQSTYGVLTLTGKRTVPDVSYDADPESGVSVYDSTSFQGQSGWFRVGGTSAGAPQWAAIRAIGKSLNNSKLYYDGLLANNSTYLRDVITGTNGTCAVYCTAAGGYDMVTGLGSPLTTIY